MAQSPLLAIIAILVGALGGSVAADDVSTIQGRWKIATVEMTGTPIPGLEDAELMLAAGKKVFTLPDGRVENGTYRLDTAKQPGEIDSTTEGRDGTEKGIYAIEGDTLKLCLATRGGERPVQFATNVGTDQLLIILRRVEKQPGDDNPAPDNSAIHSDGDPATKLTGSRNFRMGFTGFVYDLSPEAVAASRKFVRENGDIICHHIEGVPWAEALQDRPFPKSMLDEWEGKKLATPLGGKVYLAISPGRGELKVADKAGNTLPDELKGKPYDDPLVLKAYLNYCRRAIEFFKPDYLAIGIEVNEIHDLGPKSWQAYVKLHQHVYAELKKGHEDLPIFASWTLHNMFKKRGSMLEDWKKMMPHNDLVAVSYYPFMVVDQERLNALDWMTAQFDEFQKPYAMVETNDAAERLPLPSAMVVIEGNPQKQEAYYRTLLALAHDRDFAFVISFVHQDYDALWDKIKFFAPELFIAWRDCGLLDEKGNARPAFHVWKKYFTLPLQ